MIFVNMALIIWLSKKQLTVESSVFGAEFVALKHGIEELRALRYKMRMMGVPLTGPSYVLVITCQLFITPSDLNRL